MPISAHYLHIVDRNGVRIDGESDGYGFEDHIDITGWSWQVSDNAAKAAAEHKEEKTNGSTPSPKKATADGGEIAIAPSVFTFSKFVDCSTTFLLGAMYRGDELAHAIFTLREEIVKVPDDPRKEGFHLRVMLKKVYVADYKLSARASDYRVDIEETWELNYSTIEFFHDSEGGKTMGFWRPPGMTDRGRKPPPSQDQALRQLGIDPATVKAAQGNAKGAPAPAKAKAKGG
jgi:type VI protein secretion system component Hcp